MLPNVVLFQGLNASDTDSLWETNGTASGTFALTPISGEPAYGFAPDPQQSLDLTVFNNQVLFRGRYTITNYGLWTTDGTAAGTVQLTGIAGANLHCNCLAGLYCLQWRGPVQRPEQRLDASPGPVDDKRNGARHHGDHRQWGCLDRSKPERHHSLQWQGAV